MGWVRATTSPSIHQSIHHSPHPPPPCGGGDCGSHTHQPVSPFLLYTYILSNHYILLIMHIYILNKHLQHPMHNPLHQATNPTHNQLIHHTSPSYCHTLLINKHIQHPMHKSHHAIQSQQTISSSIHQSIHDCCPTTKHTHIIATAFLK